MPPQLAIDTKAAAAFNKAIKAIGSRNRLNAALSKYTWAYPHIADYWYRSGRGVPATRAAAVELATGVPCEELRPDVRWVRVPGRNAEMLRSFPKGVPYADGLTL